MSSNIIVTALATATMVATLSACGDKDAADASVKPGIQPAVAATPLVGSWLAHGVDAKGEHSMTAYAIMPDGRVLGYQFHGHTIVGQIDPKATAIDQQFQVASDVLGGASMAVDFKLAAVADGKYQGSSSQNGKMITEFTAEPYQLAPASAEQIAGSWQSRHNGGSFVIGVDGNIVGSGADSGCQLTGKILPVAATALYDLNVTLSNCQTAEQNGSYQGGAFIWKQDESIKVLAGVLTNGSQARPAHLARLEQLKNEGRLLVAGPLPAIDAVDPGPAGFTGSCVIAEFASLEDAERWAAADPYIEAGVYAKVTVKPFKKVLP